MRESKSDKCWSEYREPECERDRERESMLMQKMCKYLPYYKRIRVFCVSVRDTRISTLKVVVRSLRYVLLIALSLRRYLHIFCREFAISCVALCVQQFCLQNTCLHFVFRIPCEFRPQIRTHQTTATFTTITPKQSHNNNNKHQRAATLCATTTTRTLRFGATANRIVRAHSAVFVWHRLSCVCV